MKKRILCMLMTLIMLFGLSSTAFAADETVEDYRQQAYGESSVTPKGMYIRRLVGYDSTTNIVDMEYTLLGTSSATNNTSEIMTVYFYYQTTDSVQSTITGTVSATEQVNLVLSTVSAEIGLSLATSVSWTRGTNSGSSSTVSPGKTVFLRGYIPGVTICGSIVTFVYMDPYEEDGWYEYKALNDIYIPIAGHVHVVSSYQ